jgi:hypothetical protein
VGMAAGRKADANPGKGGGDDPCDLLFPADGSRAVPFLIYIEGTERGDWASGASGC